MATHSSVLAWRLPGTGDPGGLPSMGSYRVRHDGSDLAVAVAVASLKTTIWKIHYHHPLKSGKSSGAGPQHAVLHFQDSLTGYNSDDYSILHLT